MLKKILIWGFVAFLILFVAYNPGYSANVLRVIVGIPARIVGWVSGTWVAD